MCVACNSGCPRGEMHPRGTVLFLLFFLFWSGLKLEAAAALVLVRQEKRSFLYPFTVNWIASADFPTLPLPSKQILNSRCRHNADTRAGVQHVRREGATLGR